ncbi:MAG: molybdenum hydroxylase, partial [Oribacterium sp.]
MLVYIRGAGDIASGIAVRLYRAGMELVMSDLAVPTAVRRSVAFSEAVRLGSATVEEISAKRAESIEDVREILSERKIAVLVDSGKESIRALRPDAVVDAILAKRNLGTSRTDAPIVLGVGPGFFAGIDC